MSGVSRGIVRHVRRRTEATAIHVLASIVTVLETALARRPRRKPRAAPSAVPNGSPHVVEVSDLACVVFGLLRLAPQEPNALARQLGLRVDEVHALLAELEAHGCIETAEPTEPDTVLPSALTEPMGERVVG